jgi:hypothetical protein
LITSLLGKHCGYSCGAQVISGLLNYGDITEIGSLIAPRPAIWEVGRKDPLAVAGWVENGHVWNGETTLPPPRADAEGAVASILLNQTAGAPNLVSCCWKNCPLFNCSRRRRNGF